MNQASAAWAELLATDQLAEGRSPIHRLHPAAKLLATVLYIATVVSYPKYQLSALSVLVLYPAVLYRVAQVPIGLCFYRLRYVLPLVLAVGIANPFLDTAPALRLGGITVTAGVLSMLTLMLKGTLALLASFLLVATTKVDALCAGLRLLRLPELLVTLFLLTYRYLAVLMEQVAVMSDAYALRAPGQKGIHISAWGSFLGQLLLRSMDRARELYQSMLLRGFDGSFAYLTLPAFTGRDGAFLAGSALVFAAARFTNLAALLGGLVV